MDIYYLLWLTHVCKIGERDGYVFIYFVNPRIYRGREIDG